MKNRKNTNLLIILVVAVIILIVLINIVFKKVENENPNKTGKDMSVTYTDISKSDDISEEDKAIIEKYPTYTPNNKYVQTLDVEEKKEIIKSIDEVLNAINTKDYSWLYSRIDKDYLEIMFSSQKEFENHMSALTNGATDYTCEYYDVKYYGNECVLISESGGNKIEVEIEYTLGNENDYQLTFEKGIISVEKKYGRIFSTSDIVGVLDYEILCNNSLDFIFKLKNNGKKSIECSFADSKLSSEYGEYKLKQPKDTITIGAGQEKSVRFSFDIRSTTIIRPNQMYISCVIDEKEYTDSILIDFSDDEFDF